MAAKRKVREITKIRRQDILAAAERLFSQKDGIHSGFEINSF
jgi:AcrR family transcriptional regulator